jgi:hypothetical protein
MNNVVDFPIADRPITEAQVDKLHSEAFRDLEGRLCDCVHMANIAAQLMCNHATTDGNLAFAVYNTERMLTVLKADYHAAYHGEKPLEP